jgi:glucose-6-phosphate isomerase
MQENVGDLFFDFSKQATDGTTLAHARATLAVRGVYDALQRLAKGDVVNITEGRAATHMRERNPAFSTQHATLRTLSDRIAASGITTIVNLGIGGSDLGLRLADDVFRGAGLHERVALRFCTGLDPVEWREAIAGLSPRTTAFVLASKSFTTLETLTTGNRAKVWLGEHADANMFATSSSPAKAKQYGITDENIAAFDESVGGRYSLWSAINLPLRVAYGNAAVEQLLAGAHATDKRILDDEHLSSSPYLAAISRQFNRNSLNITNNVIVPYAWALRRLAEYLQQLVMESNGKRVDVDGHAIDSDPCSAFWGTVGTAAQHAYFQWLHQHPDGAAVEIIVVKPSDDSGSVALFQNAVAQSRALAFGLEPELDDAHGAHKRTLGNHPNTLIGLPEVTPYTLGALLAHYEASVFIEAFINNINPFDQYGVEYGKQLAREIANGKLGELDPSTRAALAWAQR